MEKLFLVLLFIDTFIRVFFKQRSFGLQCGLFGFNGNKPPDLNKIKILGLYNESRGVHSCGIWYDNLITKGIDKQKLFKDFLAETIFRGGKDNRVFIGHTRQATTGSHTLENAHPFLINNRLVMAHNGTVPNVWQLCTENNIDHGKIFVDSLALGHLIDKLGWEVLNQYKGFAALLIQKLDEPNNLYVYHGASRNKDHEKTEWEERPMYYLETKEGIYFSSMENSLNAIRVNDKEKPEILPHNIVYKITDGKFTNEKVYIQRGDINVEKEKAKDKADNRFPESKGSTFYMGRDGQVTLWKPENKSNVRTPDKDPNVTPLIYLETKPSNSEKANSIYFYKGRYWINDTMARGLVYVNKKGYVVAKDDNHGQAYFFWKGVMLEGQTQYNELVSMRSQNSADLDESYNVAMLLSKRSKYPMTNLPEEASNVTDQYRYAWWHNGDVYQGAFTPKFSKRHYHIEKGVLKKISTPDRKDHPMLVKNQETKIVSPTEALAENSDYKNVIDDLFPANCENNSCLVGHNKNAKVIDINTKKGKDESVVIVETTYNDLWSVPVQTVAKQLRKVYESLEEVYSEVSSTGLGALLIYISKLYLEQNNCTLEPEYLAHALDEMITECVDSKITLEEGMVNEAWVDELEWYIQQAIDEENADVTEAVSKSAENVYNNSVNYDSNDSEEIAEYNEELQKSQDDLEAKDMIEDLIKKFDDIEERADDLQTLNLSDLAQEVAYETYRKLDNMKLELIILLNKFSPVGTQDLIKKIKKHKNGIV